MIEKKEEYSRKLKEYERQKVKEEKEQKESQEAERLAAVDKFEKSEKNILQKNSLEAGGSKGSLPSFWIPSLTPQAEKTKLTKPDKTVYCPMSRKPLKMKDLIEVKFKELRDDEVAKSGKKRSLISREERYVCAVTNDVLSNSTPVAVLRPTGDVVTVECVEKIIKKD